MDITFIVISIVFIIFIIIAYFLKVLRLSIPLVMIYCVFCFNYLIDNDNNDYNLPKKINKQNIINETQKELDLKKLNIGQKIIFFYNVTNVVYNIKPSFNYRSWSRKTIYPNQTGQWRVDVIDSYDNVLGTRDFTIKSISSSY